MRQSWDDYFLNIAQVVSTRSTCIRRQFGCVLVKDKRIIATGYNGSPSSDVHCLDVGCAREPYVSGQGYDKCRAVHAEQNALLYAGQMAQGCTAYIVGFEHGLSMISVDAWHPTYSASCVFCEKLLISAGVKRVIFTDKRSDVQVRDL